MRETSNSCSSSRLNSMKVQLPPLPDIGNGGKSFCRGTLVLDVLKCFADLVLNLVTKLDVVCQEGLDGFASLCELAVAVAEP